MEKVGLIDVKFHSEGDSSENHPLCPAITPSTTVLNKGTVVLPGALALPCDIVKDQDISVKLRDGTTIYVDVLRPNACQYKLPAIICWGPFGKNGGVNRTGFGKRVGRCGVPQRTVSGLENFEAPDPAYWCNHGYVKTTVKIFS
jgi:predicted acyl esterase